MAHEPVSPIAGVPPGGAAAYCTVLVFQGPQSFQLALC